MISDRRYAELKKALELGHICLHYQPICDLATGETVGWEALARWKTHLGVIEPRLFIPALLHSNLLELWIERQIAEISIAQGQIKESQWIAINLSPESLRLPNLKQLLGGVRHLGRLHLEILETSVTRRHLTILRDLGGTYLIKADDVGAGFAGFDRFLNPDIFSAIKLDRTLVRPLSDSPRYQQVVTEILRMASICGLVSIAEWVQAPSQVAWLVEHGCDQGQGEFFGMPTAQPQESPQ